MTNNQQNSIESEKKLEPEKKPNEVGGFYFSSAIKIIDPNTNEVLVQLRGDN